MKCLYEVLGVEPSCEDAAIRTAYRKLALKYHPDKNADKDPAAAEEIFKEVQNAYEILSDQHERAWYDSHRDAILRSDDRHQAGSAGEGLGVRPDDYVDVYAYFTTTCFSGFGDGPRGFYTVYNNLFSALAQQEATAAAARADRRGGSSRERLPSFGLSASPWSEVGAFYAEWSLFATTKDFSWADEYHTATAPNRRVRRAMEQENEKKRKVARKEYNEGVRALIDFVRKRDKRVAAHQVEEAKRRTEREEAQQARREVERQERLARAAAYQDAAWARSESSNDDSDDNSSDDDSAEQQLSWYCPVCEKHFKSEASLANHEKSKKHREELEALRHSLEEEEKWVEYDGDEKGDLSAIEEEKDEEISSDDEEISSDDDDDEIEGNSSSSSLGDDDDDEDLPSTPPLSSAPDNGEEEDDDIMDEDALLASLINSRVSLNTAAAGGGGHSSSEEDEPLKIQEDDTPSNSTPAAIGIRGSSDDDDDGGWGMAAAKKGKKKTKRKNGQSNGEPVVVIPSAAAPLPQKLTAASEVSSEDEDWKTTTATKKGKKKGKKGAKNAAAAHSASVALSQCTVCAMQFDSRNQLFKHISATGHAQLK